MPRYLNRSPVSRQSLAASQSMTLCRFQAQDLQTTRHQNILGLVTQEEYPMLGYTGNAAASYEHPIPHQTYEATQL